MKVLIKITNSEFCSANQLNSLSYKGSNLGHSTLNKIVDCGNLLVSFHRGFWLCLLNHKIIIYLILCWRYCLHQFRNSSVETNTSNLPLPKTSWMSGVCTTWIQYIVISRSCSLLSFVTINTISTLEWALVLQYLHAPSNVIPSN